MENSKFKVVVIGGTGLIGSRLVTKLADRGSSQTLGLVTDVGLFLHRLAQNLQDPASSS